MSTSKTPNYQLHAWEPSDDFRLHEINENFAAIDQVLQGLSHKRIRAVSGAYRGNGTVHHVDLGGHPLAVQFEHKDGIRYSNTNYVCGGMAVRGTKLHDDVIIDETGFSFLDGAWDGVNMNNATYLFLAIIEDE